MDLRFTSDFEHIDWTALAELIERAPLGRRDLAALQHAFRHSTHVCFVYIDNVLVGAGRALSDGVWRAALFDIVVLPEYQGSGIGGHIVDHLVEAAGVDVTLLYTVPGTEPFYEKHGFRKMKTAMARVPDVARGQARGLIE